MIDDNELLPEEIENEAASDETVESYSDSETDELSGETLVEMTPPDSTEPSAVRDMERLRQPRAQNFRRRIRNQVSMLPLALFLLALGGFLLARERNVEGLPDVSNQEMAGAAVLVTAFTLVFRSIVFGRRERGLLFFGSWVLLTVGGAALVYYEIDNQADAAKWWPIVLVSLSATLLFTYLIERTHDSRLVLLSLMALVAGGVALWITNGGLGDQSLDKAADYWPLLLSIAGIGLLPFVFRRQTG